MEKNEAMVNALERMVCSARKAFAIDKRLMELGYRDTPYFEIYGEIADAIYYMLNEQTDTFDKSVAYRTLHDKSMTDLQCAEKLFAVFKAQQNK